MTEIKLHPIAVVANTRNTPIDDFWGEIISEITLLPEIPEDAFLNIESFSHLEIIFYFDKVDTEKIVFSGRPRGNPEYPLVGILGQRKKDRPNQIGLCRVELVSHSGRTIRVKHLDAIDGTPILDIKPVFKEFEISGEFRQPSWVQDLMKDYWK